MRPAHDATVLARRLSGYRLEPFLMTGVSDQKWVLSSPAPHSPVPPSVPTSQAPQPPAQPTARCETTVQNVTGMGEVLLKSADFGPGDRWNPAPPVGQSISAGQSITWASEDPPPGACDNKAQLEFSSQGAAAVVWNLSEHLRGHDPAVTCTTSDDAFPCSVSFEPVSADGVLRANVRLEHR